jgi:hypothetical protein
VVSSLQQQHSHGILRLTLTSNLPRLHYFSLLCLFLLTFLHVFFSPPLFLPILLLPPTPLLFPNSPPHFPPPLILSLFCTPRPKGGYEAEFSLAPIAPRLSELLGITVPLVSDCVGPIVTEAVSKVRAVVRSCTHADIPQ